MMDLLTFLWRRIWVVLGWVLGIGVVGGSIGTFIHHFVTKRRTWNSLADEYGLTLETEPGQYTLEGTHRGRRTVLTETRIAPEKFWTVAYGELGENVPDSLYLLYEGFGADVGSALGGGDIAITEDVEVDHQELDQSFITKGEDSKTVRNFLEDEAVARALIEANEKFDGILVQGGTLYGISQLLFTERADLKGSIDKLADSADAIDEAAAASQ